jgi:hypothetical protein
MPDQGYDVCGAHGAKPSLAPTVARAMRRLGEAGWQLEVEGRKGGGRLGFYSHKLFGQRQ